MIHFIYEREFDDMGPSFAKDIYKGDFMNKEIQKSINLKQFGLIFILMISFFLAACGPFYQENKYGNGHYLSQEDKEALASATPDPDMDYQAFQSNFVSISVTQLTYKQTPTLSYITAQGSCLNPGFQMNSIYYTATDPGGSSTAPDGLPYLSNLKYYPGTSKLVPTNTYCNSNGTWYAIIPVPTYILNKLARGHIQFFMVVWYKGQEIHNSQTGVSTVSIDPPPMADDPTNTDINSDLNN